MKKIPAALLAALIVSASFVSCAKRYTDGVMYIESTGSVSDNFLYLLAADQKKTYSGVVDTLAGGDWDAVADEATGRTYADFVEENTVKAARNSLICEYLHDTVYKLSLSKEKLKKIDDVINTYIKAYGSKRAFEEALSAYSADIDAFRRYYTLTAKQANLYNTVFGDDGDIVTEDDVRTYFREHYAIVTHIYFNVGYRAKEDGSAVSLTDEEKAQKKETAQTVYERILAGEDFDALKAEYSEDTYESDYYPNGFFVTNDTSFPAAFTEAALDMKIGEVRLVESSDGTGDGLHIMKKLPMDDALYNSDEAVYRNIRGIVLTDAANEMMEEYAPLVVTDEQTVASFDISSVPAFALTAE